MAAKALYKLHLNLNIRLKLKENKQQMTNIITILSLSIIIAFFFYFCWEAKKLNKAAKSIQAASESEDILNSLRSDKLSNITEMYKGTIKIKINGDDKTNVPASEYFNEISIGKAFKFNMRMLDSASGVLVGLGLLGTFLGLTVGIQGFNSSTTGDIQTSIQGLLDGMGTAFMTSLAGMGLSLVFTVFFDKPKRKKLQRSIINLDELLNNKFFVEDFQLIILNQQEQVRRLSDNICNRLEYSSKIIVDEIKEAFTYTSESGEKASISNAVRVILRENEEQTKALKSFSTDLAIELNNGFDEALSRQMQAKILPLMENVDATTKIIVDHIDQMASAVSSPVSDMLETVISDLKTSMNAIIVEFKDSVSKSANTELENLAKTLGNATTAIQAFPQIMEKVSVSMTATIEDVTKVIKEITKSSSLSNSEALQSMQNQINAASTYMNNTIDQVREVMSSIALSSKNQANEVMTNLTETVDKMTDYINTTFKSASSSMNESINAMTTILSDNQTNMLSMQNDSALQMKNIVDSITKTTKDNQEIIQSNIQDMMISVLDDVKSNISEISSKMNDSFGEITKNVSNSHLDLITLQDGITDKITIMISAFDNGIDKLDKANVSLSNTMEQFQIAQSQITGSTSHLQSISEDMKEATRMFTDSILDYQDNLNEMQVKCQESVDGVESLLKESAEISNEYSQKFEIIRNGLSSIFSQLQTGLTEYSRTVQVTTQKYLDQYSTSLTNTTDKLSSAISQQNEVVEMLVSSLDKSRH